MSTLQLAWAASLVITLWLLPVGFIRMLAYRSREIDHTSTMRTAAWVAVSLGAVSLAVFITITIALAT